MIRVIIWQVEYISVDYLSYEKIKLSRCFTVIGHLKLVRHASIHHFICWSDMARAYFSEQKACTRPHSPLFWRFKRYILGIFWPFGCNRTYRTELENDRTFWGSKYTRFWGRKCFLKIKWKLILWLWRSLNAKYNFCRSIY